MNSDITVIGVDPSLSKTGYGVIAKRERKLFYVSSGVIATSSREAFPVRIEKIYNGLKGVLEEFRPQVMVVEEAIYTCNVRTALMLGQARGVVLLAGVEKGLLVREFSPAKIKVAVVGNGSATKEQVNYMVMNILGLKGKKLTHDETDALAGAICYLFQNDGG